MPCVVVSVYSPVVGDWEDDADDPNEPSVNADAVLIFLPGLKEIQSCQEAIFSTRAYQSEQVTHGQNTYEYQMLMLQHVL